MNERSIETAGALLELARIDATSRHPERIDLAPHGTAGFVLANGSLAIVQHQGGYEVIPREAALKIQERDPRRIVQLNILVEPKTPEEDDPYAAYQIPDDLMW